MKRRVQPIQYTWRDICLAVLYKDGIHCCIREAGHSSGQHLDVRGFRWTDGKTLKATAVK